MLRQQVAFFVMILIGLFLAYLVTPTIMSQDYFFWVLLLVGLCITVFLVIPDSNSLLRDRVVKHSHLLVLSVVIVNFQYPIDFVLGNSLSSDKAIWVEPAVTSKSLILSCIGLISFFIGYLAFSNSAKEILKKSKIEPIYNVVRLKIFAFLLLSIYFYTVNPLYLAGGYIFAEMGSSAKYAALALNACILALVVQVSRNCISKNKEKNEVKFLQYLGSFGVPVLLLVGIYLTSVTISGDRGPIVTTVLAFLGGYLSVSGRRYSLPMVFVFIVFASFSMGLLGVARSFAFDSELSFMDKVQAAYTAENDNAEQTISSFTKELAGSINTLHYAVDYIPKQHDFLFGKFQLEQLILAIPFASRIYYSFWDEAELRKYADISTFITWIAQGDYPSYGNGSSLFADFYVAAGVFGVITGMIFAGWLIRRAEYIMYSSQLTPLLWYIFSIVYFSLSIYIGRSSFFEGLKLVFLVFLFIYINRIFSSRKLIVL